MIPIEILQCILGTTIGLPVLSLCLLSVGPIFGHRMSERRVHHLLAGSLSIGVLGSTVLFIGILCRSFDPFSIELGNILSAGSYNFDLTFHLDLYGGMFLWLTMALVGLVGAFSANYLHQDEGYLRFYWLLLAFVIGLEIVALGRGLDLLFIGWELLGISSTLLIAYFIRRPEPMENGLRAFAAYRITDIGLLSGIVMLHHVAHTTALSHIGALEGSTATIVGGLLIFGAMGKGAIIPFTPWLPRAMEGPTPSSAIFYGALSIHASPFLLLRIAPLLDEQWLLKTIIVILGLLTSAHASMVGRTQNDVKTGLAYAAVAQVGLIWVWIGFGFYNIAAIHLFGHSILRTWQLLRAPSVLHERHELTLELGADMNMTGKHIERFLPVSMQRWCYRFALERWYLDELWDRTSGLVGGILSGIDRLDQKWAGLFDKTTEAIDASTLATKEEK